MVFYIFHSIALAHLAPNPRPFQIGTHPYSSLPVFWHAVFWHKQQRLHAIMMEFIVLIVDLCSHLSYSDFCRQFPSAWNLQFLKPHCGRSILIVHPPVCMLAATTLRPNATLEAAWAFLMMRDAHALVRPNVRPISAAVNP